MTDRYVLYASIIFTAAFSCGIENAVSADKFTSVDQVLSVAVASQDDLPREVLHIIASGTSIAHRQRRLFAEALERLAPARSDLASIEAERVDILRSLLSAVASEIHRENIEKIANGLPDLQAAIWTTYVEPMRRNAETFGLVPLASAEGKPVGRWYDTPSARAVSVFELFADTERKTLSWSITDIDDRRSAVASDVIRAVKRTDGSTSVQKLVVYLETSGLDASGAIERLRAADPARLRVIAEDVAAVVDRCVAAAKAPPPLPAAKPETEEMRGTIDDTPAEAGKPAKAPDKVSDAQLASLAAKKEPKTDADTEAKEPVFDEAVVRRTCESQVVSVSSSRDVAVIVDPRRQIGVWSVRLMLPADVDRASDLAASLVKDWP